MKKFTLILTLIVLVSLGSVFAEEANLPSFWMSAESTAIIASDSDESQMTSWTNGAFYAAGINWSDDVSGLAISFEGRKFDLPELPGAAEESGLRQFEAYYMFLDGMLKTTVGKVRNGDYRFVDYIGNDGMMTRLTGSSVQVKLLLPENGFHFTVNLPVGDQSVSYPYENGFVIADSNDNFASMGFGAVYKIPGLAKFIVSGKMNANSFADDGYDYFYAAADVYAVKNIGLRVIFENGTEESLTDPAYNHIGLAARYVMDEITLAEEVFVDLPDGGDTSFSSQTAVYYAMGSTVPGLEFTFANDGTDNDITVYPHVAFNIGGGELEIGVAINNNPTTDTTWSIPVQATFGF